MLGLIKNQKFKYILIITLIFFLSVTLKWDYIGTLSDGHHQFVTAQYKIFVENWFYEGFKKNNFLNIWIPESINYNFLNERIPYVSYPAGSQYIIYFIKLIFENTETLKIIHLSSLTIHYIIVILIFFFISQFKFDLNYQTIYFFAAISSISYIFFPIAFYYHLMLFSYDTIIILSLISVLFLEYLIRSKKKNVYFFLQSTIFFISAFLDYFIITIAFSIFLFRIIFPIEKNNFFKNILQIIVPMSIPFSVHVYHLYYNDFHIDLLNRFLKRSGIKSMQGLVDKKYDSFIFHFWIKKLNIYLPILITSLVFLIKKLVSKKLQKNENIVLLSGFLSCIMYSLLLQDYAAIHDFSALKFFSLLSITFFSIMPLTFLEYFNKNKLKILTYYKFNISIILNPNFFKYLSIIFLFCLIILDNSIRYIWLSKQDNSYLDLENKKKFRYLIFSQFPNKKIEGQELSKLIGGTSKFEDVYFSFTDFFIKRNPPQKLSFSRKIVKKIISKDQLNLEIRSLPENAIVKIIINKSNDCKKEFFNKKKILFKEIIILKLDKIDYNKIFNCI